MKVKWMILVLFLAADSKAQSPQEEKHIREGNEYYMQQKFDRAVTAYEKALQVRPGHSIAKYNLATTLFKLNKPDEALSLFNEVGEDKGKTELKAKAYYNSGAILSRQNKPEESVEAYKKALRINPDDKEARENLQKALLELKKKNPPKKKEEQDRKKKEQEQQQKQKQSRISPKEAQQRLQLLAQKEKEVQQRIQKEKSNAGGSQVKDW
ncbi:MAG: tetratricopeptide repeat protein [Chitinophagaceae bacterium]